MSLYRWRTVVSWSALGLCALVAPSAHAQAAGAAAAGGLSVEAAVQRAVERSERAQIAELQVQSAEAHVDKARSFFLPDVTVSGTYTRRLRESSVTIGGVERVTQDQNALNGSLVIGVTLFDGRGFPLYAQASLEREAAVLDAAEQRRTLAFDTVSLFLATLSQEQVLNAAETRVTLAQQSTRDAQQRFEVGLASSNDVTQVELELSAAQRDLTAARAEVRRARLDLGYLLDQPVEQPLVQPTALLDAASASAQALAQQPNAKPEHDGERLDIAAQYKRAEALRAGADEPSWRWAPILGLQGIGRLTNEPGFSGHNFDASLALTLTWVLWDGGERTADRDDRLALASAQKLQARASERAARTDVAQALVSLERGHDVVEQAAHTAEIAQRNGRETAELYRQGLGTALAVADASNRLFSAQVELARARYDLAVGLLALRRALGLDPFGKEPAK
jgi:outer membrane protein TolC